MAASTSAATTTITTTVDDKSSTSVTTSITGQHEEKDKGKEKEPLPYWLVNVPRDQWPSECPEYLRDLVPKSIRCLSTPDEEYKRISWDEVQDIIRTNQIDRFQRVPSDLRRYYEYTAEIKKKYGSVMNFIVRERLHWGEGRPEDLKPKGKPFEYDEDIKILYNDWPYGVEKGIIHLVVWTKFELEDDPETDDLTPKARREIDEYVRKTFCSRVPPEKVVWFKNWKSLKSVHAVEHFHVMLNNPDMEFVKEITNGDVPLAERAKNGTVSSREV